MGIKICMPPIVDKKAEILILGTMPGEQSLEHQEYYKHPQNHFWKIISAIYNEGQSFKNYAEKVKVLQTHNIALWDVLASCKREGSLDSAIKNHEPNDFKTFYQQHPNLKKIIFNGQGAANFYKRFIGPSENKEYIHLPSTSPANTMKLHTKLELWRAAL